jgi:hypothetical protein
MTDRFDNFAARAAPALFVLLWSTLDALSILGMVVCAAGVVLVNRPALVDIKG